MNIEEKRERMNIEEKTSSAGISAYCCLGSVHLKTASFILCLAYILGLAWWWHDTIPVIDGGRYPPVKVDNVVTIVVLLCVVLWAMIGISLENELYLVPIVIVQLFSLVFIVCSMLVACFGRTPLLPTVIILMQLVLWLALLAGVFWTMTIFLACGFLFSTNYFTTIQQRDQLLPLKSNSTTKPTAKYGLP